MFFCFRSDKIVLKIIINIGNKNKVKRCYRTQKKDENHKKPDKSPPISSNVHFEVAMGKFFLQNQLNIERDNLAHRLAI